MPLIPTKHTNLVRFRVVRHELCFRKAFCSDLAFDKASGLGFNPVCERRVNLLVYSLSFHRHSYIGFILAFASSIHNKQTKIPKSSIHNKLQQYHLGDHLDGAPIASNSHTHPSHSQTSRLLTSSLSLGVPAPRPTQCVRDE
jgi:hypothetical protein